MNEVKPQARAAGVDLLPLIVEAIRPHWKNPISCVSDALTPELYRATVMAIGRTNLATALAQYQYATAQANHSGHDDRDIEYAAATALLDVTEARLLYQPAMSATDLECRLRFFQIVHKRGMWRRGDVVPSLKQARRDVYLITEGDIARDIELNRWDSEGEPRRHGYHEDAEAAR